MPGLKRTTTIEQQVTQPRKKLRYSKKTSKISKPNGQLRFHKFIRSATFGTTLTAGMDLKTGFTLNGGVTGIYNLQFSFSLAGVQVYSGGTLFTTLSMPNYTELTALYDQYRIDYVDYQFMFSNNQSSVNSPATTLPVLYMAKDYDDANSANVTDIQQYSTQQTWQLGNMTNRDGIHHVRVKPNVDIAIYNGLTTGYARSKPMFIDTGSPSVPHYGVKIAYDPIFVPGASTNVGYLTCNFVYHLTMSHSK